MSKFKPEQFFASSDLKHFGFVAERADFAWIHQLNVERLQADGVIEALGDVLLKHYFDATRKAAEHDEYSVDDAPYRFDGNPDRLVISRTVQTTTSSRSVNAAITLKTEIEDDDGMPGIHYEKIVVARIDTARPMPRTGFTADHAWTMKEICEGRDLARQFGLLPHLNATLDELSIVPEDSGTLPRNIQLGDN
jgi:hypothetical protein